MVPPTGAAVSSPTTSARYRPPRETPHDSEHEPTGEPLRQRQLRSFIKTLKREEIYAHKYDNLEHLRTNIEEFIDEYYNRQRLHSALAYCSPEEFERKAEGQAENRGATIEVFVNNDNDEKISKGLLGKRTQMPSSSPDPFSC
jgi:hypothetical protein